MVDKTNTVAVSSHNDSDSGRIAVPADVQREFGLQVDDVVTIAVSDLGGLVKSFEFENPMNGDRTVTVPAKLMRKLNIETGESYPMDFEVVKDDSEQSDLSEINEESDDAEDSIDTDDDTESTSLGELFG